MRKAFVLALSCFVIAVLAQASFGQTRPRRVGAAPPRTSSSSTSQPRQADQTGSQPVRPSRPPVLGGANRDPNEQKPAGNPQDAGPEDVAEGDVVRVDTTLVSVPVAVMDRDGRFIPNLRKEDFHIWEDGIEQQVAYFASTEKPFTVALVIDTSGSTKTKLQEIQDAATTFINQLRPDDRVMIISFNDRIRVLAEPTSDRNTLRDAIFQTEAGSGTRLYDAVDLVINEYFNRIEGRKAIVLFTDGVDTSSKQASYESTVRDAEEMDALIYPVEYDTYEEMVGGWPGRRRHGGGNRNGNGNIFDDILSVILGDDNNGGRDPNGSRDPNGNGGNYPGGGGGGNYPNNGRRNRRGGGGTGTTSEEYEIADQYLHDLARVSGARLYNAEQQNLDYAFHSVAEELRRQYSLGYYPKTKPIAGERRNIKVRVNRPELVVRTRDSYVFQPNANNSAQTNPQPKPPVLKKELRGDF